MAKKYTLPRHTNLAKQTTRFGAAIVDLALVVAGFFVFFFGLFSLTVGTFVVNPIRAELTTYEYQSNLVTIDDSNNIVVWKSEDDYKVYDDAMRYFYFYYLSGEAPIEHKESYPTNYVPSPNANDEFMNEDGTTYKLKDFFTVEWYNKNILGIDRDDPDADMSTCYFTYVKVDDQYDKSQIGIPRSQRYSSESSKVVDITPTDLAIYLGKKYESSYRELTHFSFYKNKADLATFYVGVEVGSSLILSGAIFYILIPMIRKDGASLGKMIFKIRLAHSSGYSHHKYQLLFRFAPYLVTVSFVSLMPVLSIYILLVIVAVMFLISFALAMASPKKMSLHDFVAQTIVVSNDSIIFDTSVDERAYEQEEDGAIAEPSTGEEPELSYEK